MTLSSLLARASSTICVPLLAAGLLACASTVSTTAFKGDAQGVAQTISNLQSDVRAADEKKLCSRDLAGAVVARLGGLGGCESAVKGQLTEIDNPDATVKSVQLAGALSATAQVKSSYGGRSRVHPVSLAKEGGAWKVAALQ